MEGLNPERLKQIQQTVARITLSGSAPLQRMDIINRAEDLDLSELNLQGPSELIQAVKQIRTEATETNIALMLEDDL